MSSFEDKVRAVLADLGEDEDFVEAVKDQLDFSELAAEALQDEEVKEAAKKAVLGIVKTLFEEDDVDDFRQAVVEQLDYNEMAQWATQDETVLSALREAVIAEVKRAIDDQDSWVDDAITDAVSEHLDVAGMVKALVAGDPDVQKKSADSVRAELIRRFDEYDFDDDDFSDGIDFPAETKALVAERDPKLLEVIRALIIKQYDPEGEVELTEEEREAIWQALGIPTLLSGLMQDHELRLKLDEKLRELVDSEIEELGRGQSQQISQTILDSEAFKAAIDRVISAVQSSGKVEEFARGVVERALREDHHFQTSVMGQVQEAIASRLAAKLVEAAFGRQ